MPRVCPNGHQSDEPGVRFCEICGESFGGAGLFANVAQWSMLQRAAAAVGMGLVAGTAAILAAGLCTVDGSSPGPLDSERTVPPGGSPAAGASETPNGGSTPGGSETPGSGDGTVAPSETGSAATSAADSTPAEASTTAGPVGSTTSGPSADTPVPPTPVPPTTVPPTTVPPTVVPPTVVPPTTVPPTVVPPTVVPPTAVPPTPTPTTVPLATMSGRLFLPSFDDPDDAFPCGECDFVMIGPSDDRVSVTPYNSSSADYTVTVLPGTYEVFYTCHTSWGSFDVEVYSPAVIWLAPGSTFVDVTTGYCL